MADHDPWLGRPVFERIQQALEVVHELIRRPGMALQPVRQQPCRQALAAPVMGHDAQVARQKVADNLVIFLDRLRPARRNEDRAARWPLRFPVAQAQTQAPGAGSVAGAVETRQGAAGARVSESIANWVVVRVDPAANTITLVNPGGGEVRTYDVTTDAGRQQLPRVKQGDNLTEINSRLVVAAITPRS